MDQELRQYLDAKFARIDCRFAGIDEKFAELATRREFAALEDRIVARLEGFEAAIAAACRDLSCPMEVRVPSVPTRLAEFYERRAVAEQRISELERRRAS
jgi:hypothetical protein